MMTGCVAGRLAGRNIGSERWIGKLERKRKIGSKNWIENTKLDRDFGPGNRTQHMGQKNWIADLANFMIQFYDPISDPMS